MKIIMLETKQGSPNGIRVETYFKDKEYDIPESLGDVFIGMKVASKIITNVASGIVLANKVTEHDDMEVVPETAAQKKIRKKAEAKRKAEVKALNPNYENKALD